MRDRLTALDRERWSERAALLSCLVTGAFALWLLARLVWALMPRGDTPAAAPAPPPASTGAAPASSVAKWHLFGSAPLPRGGTAAAPATALTMQLRGTLADRDPKAGIAVISDEGGIERAWRVGERLASGVTLAEVYPDHVTLLHDGTRETLRLPRDAPSMEVEPAAPGGKASAVTAAANPLFTAPKGSPAASADVQRTMRELRTDPAGVARRMQVLPVFDGGKLSGVRLAAGADASLVTRLGLRPTDVVTAVDGTPIGDFASGRRSIEALQKAGRARVTVLRDGRSLDIDVTLP
jgi:general secretion pathway protein C